MFYLLCVFGYLVYYIKIGWQCKPEFISLLDISKNRNALFIPIEITGCPHYRCTLLTGNAKNNIAGFKFFGIFFC